MARRSNGRKFVWARSRGVYMPGQADGPGADLLLDFKARAGGNVLIGATVMTVRGIIVPDVAGGELEWGTFGIRVCNLPDVESEGEMAQTPDANPEADWMAFMPYMLDYRASGTPTGSASWNESASMFTVDVGSNRRMEEVGETLGLFFSTGLEGTFGVDAVRWTLSVGLKLP